MPRTKAASRPGTERYRDERRNDSKPKMHGKQWHDHRGHIEGEPGSRRGMGAAPEVEGSPEKIGMGKTKAGTRGPKRKRLTPVGKGRRGERAKNA